MKFSLSPAAVAVCFLSLISSSALAANKETISSRTQNLEREVAELQQEISELRAQKSHRMQHAPRQHYAPAARRISVPAPSALPRMGGGGDQASINGPHEEVENIGALPLTGSQYLPVDLNVPGQSIVSTGPYIGVPMEYSGSDLIINSPYINQDVALLNMRKNIELRLAKLGYCSTNPHLLLSGLIETQANYHQRGTGGYTSDIDLTSVNLDAYILGPDWVTGIIALAYENDIGSYTGSVLSNLRVANSRIFLNNAFITISNFRCSPFYLSMGQMYVPFGLYSSSMITSPLTKPLFRTKARAINVGYQGPQTPVSFYAAAYIFRGDARVNRDARINNGGVNLGLKFKNTINCVDVSGDIGAGYIANTADAFGVQKTDNRPLFDGFGSDFNICGPNGNSPCGSERLAHRAPGADIHASLSIGKEWDFLAEYITVTRGYALTDLTYNSHGARPRALNAEAAYTFQNLCKPLSLAVGYGFSRDALAIALPQTRYATTLSTSLWRNTVQSLEFRRDQDYPASAVSSGSQIAGPNGTGKWDNVVTAQFDFYF